MSEEYSPLSFPPLVDGGAGKPYALLADEYARSTSVSVNMVHIQHFGVWQVWTQPTPWVRYPAD